jgi:HEAT repeat protein
MICEKGNSAPLLVELKNYQQPDTLLNLLAQVLCNRFWLEKGLRTGCFLLQFDGMNEIPQELIPSFVNDLNLLRAEFPNNGIVLTCRPADYPNSFSSFIHMRVSPLDQDQIISFLKSVLGDIEGEDLFASLDDRLSGLCENPYMLTMLALTYKSTGRLPTNRAKLYQGFLDEFLIEESNKGGGGVDVSLNVKHDLLSDLAFFMANKTVSIEISKVQTIIGRKLLKLKQSYDHEYFVNEVMDELLSNGLIHLDSGNISFMHQSIQEFYTAKEIAEQLSTGSMGISDLTQFITDSRWYETIKMLAGLLDDATEIVAFIMKSDLLLASECIHASTFVDPSIVDSAIVQAVTEFKFGTEPFSYTLIFSLKRIGDRRSENLSQRVIDDMTHWCDKFAATTPRTLVGMETEELLKILKEVDRPYIIPDAIWTLGVRQEVRAVNSLIEILLDRKSPFRADAARSLGRIKDKRATAALLSFLNSPDPKQLRPFIFMALGSIADPASYQPLINYLSNINNPYRETAAWALVGIADDSIADFLIANLRKGTPYARANFVFLLGHFKIKKGLQELINLMMTEHDPFVREDIAFALGEYHDKSAIDALLYRLDDQDSLVRVRVAEALGKLGEKSVIPRLEELLLDESDFVRESVKKSINCLRPV